jgi:hypothetical protein
MSRAPYCCVVKLPNECDEMRRDGTHGGVVLVPQELSNEPEGCGT